MCAPLSPVTKAAVCYCTGKLSAKVSMHTFVLTTAICEYTVFISYLLGLFII